jgi:hypothetical protein
MISGGLIEVDHDKSAVVAHADGCASKFFTMAL